MTDLEYEVRCKVCKGVLATFKGKQADFRASDFAAEHEKVTGHTTKFGEKEDFENHAEDWQNQEEVKNRDEVLH